jgi:hypothetical protein
MLKIKKLVQSLMFEAILLGAAALLLYQKYGNLAWIPAEDLAAYSFWLILASTGMIILWIGHLFYIGKAPKTIMEPPHRSHKKTMKPRKPASLSSQKEAPKKPEQQIPKAWADEEFE